MLFKYVEGPATLAVQTMVAKVSARFYADNLRVDARTAPPTKKGNACRFVLRCKDSRAEPARLSGTGRRTVAANWEAHRLVMQELFELYPNAVLVTAITTYTGKDDFERRYQATWTQFYKHYYDNAGNPNNPVKFGSL